MPNFIPGFFQERYQMNWDCPVVCKKKMIGLKKHLIKHLSFTVTMLSVHGKRKGKKRQGKGDS